MVHSKRNFKVIVVSTDGKIFNWTFNVQDIADKFENYSDLKDTELAYTLEEEIDTLLDMTEGEIKHFFEDRAQESPCLIVRTQ